jgi:hypothetical protein
MKRFSKVSQIGPAKESTRFDQPRKIINPQPHFSNK